MLDGRHDQVTATFRFTDPSGVKQQFIWIAENASSGQQVGPSSTMSRTSGGAYDGIYTVTIRMPYLTAAAA